MQPEVDGAGRLNNEQMAQRYRDGNMNMIPSCRHCLRPSSTDGVIVVCSECDHIERISRT